MHRSLATPAAPHHSARRTLSPALLLTLAAALAVALLWLAHGNAFAAGITVQSAPPLAAPPAAAPAAPAAADAWRKSGLWANAESKTASAALQVDKQGGIHIAWVDYVPLADHPAASYFFCPGGADCTQGENWGGVTMGDEALEVQLALTQAGKPRLLVQTNSDKQSGGRDWHYAACDGNCADGAAWETTFVYTTWSNLLGGITDEWQPQRSFALDHLDRPRFVYNDRNYPIEPDHYGFFYAACDADCSAGDDTTPSPSWSHTLIGNATPYDAEIFDYPALAFTASGGPRIVADAFTFDPDPSGIYYLACDSGCADRANWSRTYLFERGSGSEVIFDLELDAQNRSRVAFYEGSYIDRDGEQLWFAACDAGCADPAKWNKLDMGLPTSHGGGADLELTATGAAHILYKQQYGAALALASCDANCLSAGGWSTQVLETGDELDAEFPVARPVTCDAGFWDVRAPVLALDAKGNPRTAFDAAYEARCLYDDPTDNQPPYYRYQMIRKNVRVALYDPASPGGGETPGAIKAYLPLVTK